jgi:ADP-heptose:LPS heptosyltransferase
MQVAKMKRRHAEKSNVLLVNITRLGDMLQATPTIAGIKQENPQARITVLVEKQFTEVCHTIPGIDEVVSLDLSLTVRSLAREGDGILDAYDYLTEIVEDLRKRDFDYCLNMSSSGYTALLLKLIGIERNGGWTVDDEGYRIIASDWARLFASSVFHQNREYNSLNLVDVFRCSADVEQHPEQLVISVAPEAQEYAEALLTEANFSNKGPLICVQAGASQEKRQWRPANFVRLIKVLTEQHAARVVLTGTKKELRIIEPILEGCGSANVFSAAGRTSIPQLAALLKKSDLLVTGDTGTMHLATAVATPCVAMFLASAFGFETGPYLAENIILQPHIACGPCNPNKPCARPDCHELIDPEALAQLAMLRARGPVRELPEGLFDARNLTVWRTTFDRFGFYDLVALTPEPDKELQRYRDAYRKLWLDDLAGFTFDTVAPSTSSLRVVDPGMQALAQVAECAQRGQQLIQELLGLVRDSHSPASALGKTNSALTELDRTIENIGFRIPPLGPITRMFIFAKENIQGTGVEQLASEMKTVYTDLERRACKLGHYYAGV